VNATQRAVIVRGGWDGHQPVETTNEVIPFLEANGFEISVHDGPGIYADADVMTRTDLIVQTMTMSTIGKDELAGLIAAVRAGTGLAGWHGGIADSYRNEADYLHLIGGQFAHHAQREEQLTGQQSDYFQRYTVHITDLGRRHPITRGIDDFHLETEQYWVLSDEYNDVLATVTQEAREFDPWHRPVTSPAIWTRQWGAGRIFVCTPGHELDVVRNPDVRVIIERGLLWAARGQYAEDMSKQDSGRLHEPTGEWWYNNKTGEVEHGPQSLGVDRDGPFATREEAERAPEIFAERSRQWAADDD
jgi:type 1 glutamine amidotransferase